MGCSWSRGASCSSLKELCASSYLYEGLTLASGEEGFAWAKASAPSTPWQGCGSSAAEDQSSSGGILDAGSRAHRCCRNTKSKDISYAYARLLKSVCKNRIKISCSVIPSGSLHPLSPLPISKPFDPTAPALPGELRLATIWSDSGDMGKGCCGRASSKAYARPLPGPCYSPQTLFARNMLTFKNMKDPIPNTTNRSYLNLSQNTGCACYAGL